MESLLELQETNSNLAENQKLVPWLNWEEWDFVRLSLFSSSPQSIAKALRRIAAWRCRGCLPVVIEVSASIVEIQQKDHHFSEGFSNGASESEEVLAMLYTMAIMRLVNAVIEKTRKKEEMSIAEAAAKINMPHMLIDIRHEGSHRELPSLRLLRSASIKALNWLKSYYWDSQKNAIPYQSGESVNVRKEIRSKLRELAFSLKVKQNPESSSLRVKGNRSKKQITRTMKNLVRLYSFFSSDVVSVLLEFLLDSSYSLDLVNSPENIQINLSLDVAQAVFDEWKPVISKVCKKEPELLLSLLKAVLDMIESRKIIREDSGHKHFSILQYDPEMQQMGVLSSLFKWLVLVLKGLKLTQHEPQENTTDTTVCVPKTTLIELVRRCFHISDPENQDILDSAMLLAEMVRDRCLSEKLGKLSSLTKKLHPRLVADVASGVNTIDVITQEGYIRQAAEKLELVKRRKISNSDVSTTQDDDGVMEGSSIWTVAKSWNPCPIGMLPRAVGSSGCLPVLDRATDCDTEKHLELRQSSSKTEAACDLETTKEFRVGKELQNSELVFHGIDNSKTVPSFDGIEGFLLIGGDWQRVGYQDIQEIKSHIGILVTNRKS
ncbi:pre-rRNA-processing protein las1 isoform X2 [Spinacia oleracea]|uniref:Pre-rRNA-processing protein las1 isoform X2 n=1 Tax=Spinacia oleracea TaxID=3562 RepID=A0A9R0I6B8_SPIOL|nr:pre-rRNA-processing protein las1 isoform X2 [Spinacia oleracea]